MTVSNSARDRARLLISNFYKETGVFAIDESGDNLLTWLSEKLSSSRVGIATANSYRKWIASYLESEDHPAALAVRSWLPAKSRGERECASASGIAMPNIDAGVSETNGISLTYMEAEGFKSLTRFIGGSTESGEERVREGWMIVLFLVSTITTGLRPFEWKNARLLDVHYDPKTMLTLGPVLEVSTLKQNGRREDNTLREKRYLLLDRWPAEQVGRLRTMLNNIEVLKSSSENGFELWYERSRKKLTRAWKAFAKKYHIVTSMPQDMRESTERGVSFYTARHIFAEEVRRSYQYTRYEMAAMLGHCMLRNQRYYGMRAEAAAREFEFVLPRPWPGDAEEIKEWDFKMNPIRFKAIHGHSPDAPNAKRPSKEIL